MYTHNLPLTKELELHKKYKSRYMVLDKYEIIAFVKKCLNDIGNTFTINHKLNIVRKLYSFLVVNKIFVNSDCDLTNFVKKKLSNLYRFDNWEPASEIYHFYLFNETIDGKKCNFESGEYIFNHNLISFKTVIPDKFENIFE